MYIEEMIKKKGKGAGGECVRPTRVTDDANHPIPK